jgi:hypothetical protein
MSYPNEPDYIVVQVGNGATPEVFVDACGIETSGLNQTVQSNDRYRRDCATPAAIPTRKVRVTGYSWDLTGSGVINMDQFELFQDALGVTKNFRVLYGKYGAVDTGGNRTGTIEGYYAGPGVMTAYNVNVGGEDGTAEITIAGENKPVWTEGDPTT